MNNLENEALYKEALEFAKDDDSAAGRAARQLAAALAEQLSRTKFSSGVFSEDCTAFLSIKADKLNRLDKGVITQFLKQCQEHKATEVIERFVDICTAPFFKVSLKRLSFLGEQLANTGFNDDGARCYEHATKMVRESGSEPGEPKTE